MYERTKLGSFLYNLSVKIAISLDKKPALYFLLLFTWGMIETLVGLFILLILIICGKKPKRYHRSLYFIVGSNWGGFSCSFISVIANDMGTEYTIDTIEHELGHSYQVCWLGPLWIFVVAVPSICRYWRDYYCRKKQKDCPEYESIWFEGSATDSGKAVCKSLYE